MNTSYKNIILNLVSKLPNILQYASIAMRDDYDIILNEYYLYPDTFKICLIRSQKTLVYTKYFILLEKSIKYYIDYQNILKINKLIEKHKNQIEEQKKRL